MEKYEINGDKKSGGHYRLPFGIHKGKSIATVPTSYLRWLLTQDWLADHCRFEVMDALGKRGADFNEAVTQIIN